MHRNILMICYYYPPLIDVGCKRSIAFSKYMAAHGWNPYVMTVKNPDKYFCSLGHDIPPDGVRVVYSLSVFNVYMFIKIMNTLLLKILKLCGVSVRINYFYNYICIPDIFWGWIPLTVLKGYKIVKKISADCIYVSCSPFSSGLIGAFLKLLTKKPFILDFRDAYGLDIPDAKEPFPSTELRKKINRYIAAKLLEYADLFVVVTDEMRDNYIEQYPHVRDKICVIHNGFDGAFKISDGPASKYSKFTIIYVGDYYHYSLGIGSFFDALSLLKQMGVISENNFQFLFYGEAKDMIEKVARSLAIDELVVASHRVPYEEALESISKSHLQLIRVIKLAFPTKISDGIALNVPFLAAIHSGDAENIIRRYSPGSYILNEESSELMSKAILDAMRKYKDGAMPDNKVEDFLSMFSREALTLKLEKLIQDKLEMVGSLK